MSAGLRNDVEIVRKAVALLKDSIDRTVRGGAMNASGQSWMVVSYAEGKYSIGDVELPDDLTQWGAAIVAAMAEKELTEATPNGVGALAAP